MRLPAVVALHEGLDKSAHSVLHRRLLGEPNPTSTDAPIARDDA